MFIPIEVGVIVNKNGAGAGVALLDGTLRAGAPVAVNGAQKVKVRVHVALSGSTAITVDIRDTSVLNDLSGGAGESLGYRKQDGTYGQALTFTAGDETVFLDLGATVRHLTIYASANGSPAVGDIVQCDLTLADEVS